MATIVTRSGKGSALTHAEMDANFNNLNTDKAELSGATFTGAVVISNTLSVSNTLTINSGANTDIVIDEDGIDRSSASAETFNLQNSGAGALTLQVDSDPVLMSAQNLSTLSSPLTSRSNLEIGKYPSWWEYFGSGDDGALTISASTTHAKGEYHYTNFTLNAGQILGCTSSSDSHLIIRCTGTATIAGTIDMDGDGAVGSAASTTSTTSNGGDGSFGGAGGSGGADNGINTGRGGNIYNTNISISGGAARTSVASGLSGSAVSSNSRLEMVLKHIGFISDSYATGGAGGSGAGGAINPGAGGDGGGVVIIIADTIDFQSGAVITADGIAGTYSANDGGGGGGGGGSVILIAKTMTNNGTITVTGGAGGGSGVGLSGGAGGAGYSAVVTLT